MHVHTRHKGCCLCCVSHVANKSAFGPKTNEVQMFASILGYFHDNLYVVVLMCIFIVSCGDLGGGHYDSCHMDVCSQSDHFYMLGTMQITLSLNICW